MEGMGVVFTILLVLTVIGLVLGVIQSTAHQSTKRDWYNHCIKYDLKDEDKCQDKQYEIFDRDGWLLYHAQLNDAK